MTRTQEDGRPRNPQRGLRGAAAIVRRRQLRSFKRRNARRTHRRQKGASPGGHRAPAGSSQRGCPIARPDLRVSGAAEAPADPRWRAAGVGAGRPGGDDPPGGGRAVKPPVWRVARELTIGQVNIQGMKVVMKREEVERWMVEKGIEVMAISERIYRKSRKR